MQTYFNAIRTNSANDRINLIKLMLKLSTPLKDFIRQKY